MAKQMANATKPFMARTSSEYVLGTSSDTTSRVTAKANTASVKPSSRVISVARQRKFFSGASRLFCACSGIILTSMRQRFQRRGRRRLFSQFAFPTRNHSSRQAVAQNVGGGTRHIHELVDAKDHHHWPSWKLEGIDRSVKDYQND